MKRKIKSAVRRRVLAGCLAAALALGCGGCGLLGAEGPGKPVAAPLAHMSLLDFSSLLAVEREAPAVPAYTVNSDLSNVVNLDRYYLYDREKELLAENMFVVSSGYGDEFYELYEENRYAQYPNFITVDSLMHTYHLYFSLLLNRTEKNYLAKDLLVLSRWMLDESAAQHETLRGTAWETAALRNVVFFAVGARLLDESVAVPDYAAGAAETELAQITAAGGVAQSVVTEDYLDYTQFIPRGYYEGDPVLERYFRAMMWYGQVNFAQKKDDLNRSALLMTLALHGVRESWENIYAVTSFFAGASDDLGYYEYAPAIEEAYGAMPAVSDLADGEKGYEKFLELIQEMDPPAINSVPVPESQEGDEAELLENQKGFRFMGQRFSVDAAIFQQLMYRAVEAKDDGTRRMLPDTLDVPAALGSDLALEILKAQGETEYPNYEEQMTLVRGYVEEAPLSSWSSSLYSSWLYTLLPVLEPKGEGYPSYMTSTAWQTKCLETFAGSYTELKHDTVLYAKQAMAEMGGGPDEVWDDRGYVDPEVEVYTRFALLAQQTADGLDKLGYLGDGDRENLSRLAELAEQLVTISEKELRNEVLSDEEYELIRAYGGTLEHFWEEAVREKAESEYLDPKEIPASLVTDIATDPNGTVLQVATGRPARILVVVPVDGTLRLASGTVYDFYQFAHPSSDRLTDTAWRQMIGQWAGADGNYDWDARVDKPWWTESYWYQR